MHAARTRLGSLTTFRPLGEYSQIGGWPFTVVTRSATLSPFCRGGAGLGVCMGGGGVRWGASTPIIS